MRDFCNGVAALTWLTVWETLRQRLWLLLIGIVVLLFVAIPGLQTADADDRLKLSVALVTGVTGFVTTLLAVLLAAAATRRDYEQRTGLILFTKPLPRLAYLCGRWLGVLVVLAVIVTVFVLAGSLAIALQLGGLPQARAVSAPDGWAVLHKGAVIEQPPGRAVLRLGGSPRAGEGQGVRVRFSGLEPTTAGPLEVLVRAEVAGMSMARGLDRTTVRVSLRGADGGGTRLALAPDSPYGQVPDAGDAYLVQLRDRDRRHTDLAQDYVRLQLPAEAIAADGSLVLQIDRLDGQTVLGFERDRSVLIARPGGSFLLSLGHAGLVLLAQAGLLGACAVFLVSLANVPVALLGGLALFFGGHALGILQQGLALGDYATAFQRLMELYIHLQPDFTRYPLEADLAASRVIGLATVGDAWLYYGAYAVGFLGLAWLVLRRSEL